MIMSAGGIRIAGNPIKIGNLPDSCTRRAAPALDADGERIRAEFMPARS